MPELSDENIKKVKEQFQNITQKLRDAVGPETAAALSAKMPAVKSAARGTAIRSLRAVQTLAGAVAEKLEQGQSGKDVPTAAEQKAWEASAQRQAQNRFAAQSQRTAGRVVQPSHAVPGGRKFKRAKPVVRSQRRFSAFGAVLALLAAAALVFSGVTLLRVLRPRFNRPAEEGAPVVNVMPSRSEAVRPSDELTVSQEEPDAALPFEDEPPVENAEQTPAVEPAPLRTVTINYEGVNVRDGHSTRGTKVLGKASKGEVTLLEVWEGHDQYPWYRVETDGLTGWIYGRYVNDPEHEQENAPSVQKHIGRVTRDRVNVRDGHSTKNTRVLRRVDRQDVVIIDEWQPADSYYPWYKIRLDGIEGWIFGEYVDLE